MPQLRSIALLVVSIAWCSAAAAQDGPSPKERAETHYQTAVSLYGEGRYREALDEFDAAIALSPESIFYCNRAIVLIQLKEPEEALESLETCQNTHTGGQAELAEIDAQRAAVAVMVSHVQPSVLRTVSAINAPIFAPGTPRQGWSRTESGIVFLGLGGAMIASAVTLDFLSQELRDDLEERSKALIGAGEDYREARANYDEVRNRYVLRQRIWIGLTAAGAVCTLTGATLIVTKWLSSNGADESVEVGVSFSHPGPFVRVRW